MKKQRFRVTTGWSNEFEKNKRVKEVEKKIKSYASSKSCCGELCMKKKVSERNPVENPKSIYCLPCYHYELIGEHLKPSYAGRVMGSQKQWSF